MRGVIAPVPSKIGGRIEVFPDEVWKEMAAPGGSGSPFRPSTAGPTARADLVMLEELALEFELARPSGSR